MNEGSSACRLLGKNVKRLRAQRGMSQLKLALEAGLTHTFINEIEQGRKWVSSGTLGRIASVLKVEPYVLFLPEKIGLDVSVTPRLIDISITLQHILADLTDLQKLSANSTAEDAAEHP